MMEVFYINQNKSIDRRKTIESLISQFDLQGIVNRFEALDGEFQSGNLTKGEIGCFRSHEYLIKEINTNNRLILEDDVVFNSDLFLLMGTFEKLLNEQFDILFFSTHIPYFNLIIMKQMLDLFDHMSSNPDKYSILDAKHLYRAGTMGYAVAGHAKGKIISEINSVTASGYNMAIDTLYFKMIQENKIKAGLVFPFPIACSVQPTQLNDRIIEGIPEIYDDHLNLFSGIMNHQKMMQDIFSSVIRDKLNIRNVIAALLNYKHLTFTS
jgi:GR25 family glycosyltransferase involved in LPS biosynthesis